MDNSWQSKCGSLWPLLTPSVASPSQTWPQEAQNQMFNAARLFYPHVVQEPNSAARGMMHEPAFPHPSNLSFHNSLGGSFLSLLSGPPSLLQCDLQQLSNPKPFFTSDLVPAYTNNIMISAAGSDVSRASTGLLSQTIDSNYLKTGGDLSPVVSSRDVARLNCVGNASGHGVFQTENLDYQNSEVTKSIADHTVSDSENLMEFSPLGGRWLVSPNPTHVRKLPTSNIQSSQGSSISCQSSPFRSRSPRVFCLGSSGDLLLSSTGLLGVVCSCHGLHMSISKFSEHSGLRDVNPGDAVRMDSGETVAQWRKVYFYKFGIRVPEDHSGWDWPEGSSAAATLAKYTATVPDNARSSDFSNLVGLSGQKVVNGVLHTGIKQTNAPDSWNFLNGAGGTYENNNVHPITDKQMNDPIPGCSTMSKSVCNRSPHNGSQPISSFVDSIPKGGNSFISFPNLQNLGPTGKGSNVVRFSNSNEDDNADRTAVPSNIELRLGQPSQQNWVPFGNSALLPSPKFHLAGTNHHPKKSLLPEQLIHNSSNAAGNSRAMEEHRQYRHFAADTSTSSTRREQSKLSLGNHTCRVTNADHTEEFKGYSSSKCSVIPMLVSDVRNSSKGETQCKATNIVVTRVVTNADQTEEFRGYSSSRCSVIPVLLSDIRNSSEGQMQYKATNILDNGSSPDLAGRCASHIATCDTNRFVLNIGNGVRAQFNVNELGTYKDFEKGKGVGSIVDHERADFGFHPKHRETFNLPSDSGLTFPLQAVSMAPNVSPTPSTKTGPTVKPYLLNENLSMLTLGHHVLKMPNQGHGIASLLTNHDSAANPSTSTERNLACKRDTPGAATSLCSFGTTNWVIHDSEKSTPVAGSSRLDLNKWHDISLISQGTKLHSGDSETLCRLPYCSGQDDQPSLRLGRRETINSPSSGNKKCCRRIPYSYFPRKCCCAVHTCDSSKDCDFRGKTSLSGGHREQDKKSPGNQNEKAIYVDQNGEQKKHGSEKVNCRVFHWRDVPNKVTGTCNATSKDRPANMGNYKSIQDAKSLKGQEMSNISSGSSAPAVTQASVKVDNTDSCTIDVQDTRSTSNLLVDQGSRINKSWPSDDSLGSQRSSDFDGLAHEINSKDKGSSKAPNQSSCSLIEELRVRDSLRLNRKRKEIHNGPTTDHEKPNHLQNSERYSKTCKKRKTIKWTMVDESHRHSSSSEDCPVQPDHDGRFRNWAHSSGPTSKPRRPSLPTSRTISHKRVQHGLCDDREGDDCLETREASLRKRLRSERADFSKSNSRPVICGEYGVIANSDTSKPAKIFSIRNILKTARRTALRGNRELTLISDKELKMTRTQAKNGSCDKFASEEDTGKADEDDTMCTNHKDGPITCLKQKSKKVRKRCLNELSNKDYSVVKESKRELKAECRYLGKFSKKTKDSEGHGSDLYSDNKMTRLAEELSCQSLLCLRAQCCVCGSSEEAEVNCLLECKQCLLRVHQACYGVAKVPKAHWYCRPCRTNSKNNVCVLCGYGGGAMTLALQSTDIVKDLLKAWNCKTDSLPKNQISCADVSEGQTNNSITAGVVDLTVKQWVHVVCGLWTPGTRCPNVDTMNAFDVSGASHPKAKMVCSICHRWGGSCIRCRVMDCSVQFHPWCAHQKGLLQSEVEGVDSENVGFYGRCELHAKNHQGNSDSDRSGEKELKCARTEGYKGHKCEGFCDTIPNRTNGGCFVPQEQLNAWLHINKLKSCTKGIQKLPASDIEYDCRKEYMRYKQSKGWTSLVVYKSGIHGLGLYTSQFISCGAMVVEYVGEIVGPRVADKRESEYQSGSKLQYKSACYFFRIDKENIIDATRKGGIARFVNHSCLPNCVAKVISIRHEKKVVFLAERDIYPGEEITYDYHFNNEDEGKKIPCFCNSKNCRRYLN